MMTNGAHAECYVQNKLRVSLTDDAQTVCPCLFIQLLFTSKVVNIIYIHPVYHYKSPFNTGLNTTFWVFA